MNLWERLIFWDWRNIQKAFVRDMGFDGGPILRCINISSMVQIDLSVWYEQPRYAWTVWYKHHWPCLLYYFEWKYHLLPNVQTITASILDITFIWKFASPFKKSKPRSLSYKFSSRNGKSGTPTRYQPYRGFNLTPCPIYPTRLFPLHT